MRNTLSTGIVRARLEEFEDSAPIVWRLYLTKTKNNKKSLLLALAAPAEARAAREAIGPLKPAGSPGWGLEEGVGIDLIETGVGKSQAAGGVAWVFDPARHAGVLCLGVGGALPGSGLTIGRVVLATRSVFADEGSDMPGGFRTIESMGFPPGGPGVGAWRDELFGLADAEGVVATVSTCSGTDGAAAEVVRRTGAIVEAMEGAAVAAVAGRLGVPFAELRVVSNTTGDRDGQEWDLRLALERLGALADSIAGLIADGGFDLERDRA